MKKGWQTKELSAVSAINYGYTESASSEPVGPRFLRITDIQDDRVDWDSVPYCKIEAADLPKYRLASGDIVFARTGATTGKSFLVDDPPEAVFASYLIRLRLLDKQLLPEFVSLFFQTAGYWKSIKEGSAGSAQGGFNATKLGALSIPVPPVAEQQRIVGVLDEAFAGLAAAQANAAKNLQNARALFESHLQSVFTHRGRGWVEKTLEETCEIIMGQSPPGETYNTTGQGTPLINGPVEFSQDAFGKTIRAKFTTQPTKMCRAGDLILCVRGSTTGRMNIAGSDACIGRGVAAIRAREHQPWINHFINAKREEIYRLGTGATFPNVSGEMISGFKLSMPSLSEQKRLAGEFEKLRAETQRLTRLYEQKQAALAALKKSLLHQAFAGEL
jgi:type I restriction enzyme S subunit